MEIYRETEVKKWEKGGGELVGKNGRFTRVMESKRTGGIRKTE